MRLLVEFVEQSALEGRTAPISNQQMGTVHACPGSLALRKLPIVSGLDASQLEPRSVLAAKGPVCQ